MAARRFRLITFDLDDTLWDVRPVLVRAEARVAHWMAAHCPALAERHDRESLARLRHALLTQRPELRHHISDLRREAVRLALLECGYGNAEAGSLAAQAFEVFIAARHEVEPFAGVEDCLAELARHYTLGALTNGNADVFRIGLGRFFRVAVRAETIGASKPDAAPFLAILEQAGIGPGAALHVGDHQEHDVLGARRAGMTAVWFNPAQGVWTGERHERAEFRAFSELPGLIARIEEEESGAAPTG